MIKKARFSNIFRTITGTLNRFLAISAIVALGAGFLGGLEATTPDMKAAADSYMDKYNWYDLDIVNRLGFTEQQFSKIQENPKVNQIQKAIVSDDVFLTAAKKRLTIRVFGVLPEDGKMEMNGFELKKGSFPKADDECLIQVTSIYSASVPAIGEELSILEGSEGNYCYKKVKVAGIVQGPMFFSAELQPTNKGSGFLDMAMYVRPDFFITKNVNHVFVTVSGACELDTWQAEYKLKVAAVEEEIKNQLEQSVYEQFDELIDAVETRKNVFEKIGDASNKLRKAELLGVQKNERVVSLLEKNGADESLVKALKNEGNLFGSVKNVSSKNYEPLEKVFESVLKEAKAYKTNLFSVENRSQNTGYSSYKDNIEKIASLSKVFPVFFFFIALLVALTTMTRLVEEKRTEIGTLKSLGFSGFQLLGQYLVYAFLSSLLGCVVGLVIGFKIFPAAVTLAYSMMYTIPLMWMPFRWDIAINVSLIAISVIMIATAFACVSETVARPAVLMAVKAPAPGKRIFLEKIPFIWNRLNFSRKVTIRNMFRYKRRLWMTIAGVAGCSALLVAGFGLRDSLQDIISIQFESLEKYNISILFNNSNVFENDEIISGFLNDEETVSDWIKVHGESVKIKNGEKELPLTLYVPEEADRIGNFMEMRTRKGHKPISLDGEGIVITEKQTEMLGVKPGDFVFVENTEGKSVKVRLLAASECYLYSNAFASALEFEQMFGKAPEYNAALCKLTEAKNNQETVAKVMESSNVIYAMWIDSLISNAHTSISSINIVVLVIIFTSGLLSLIVLYNLTNINICERKREIATLLVLGYTEKEAKKYIFREINILSVIGTIVGLFLGGPLHAIVVHATEVNVVMWGRTVHPISYVYAFVVSIIFTVIVNLLMKKSISEINMVESLKSKD